MNLRKLLLTNNACYKAGRMITSRGIMVHSTGADNPYLKRYVGPSDGFIGHNRYDNHWNRPYPEGRQVCAHAFIGRLEDGAVATYQTLPWNYRGWHCGSGSKGSGNDTHISFEICEDGLLDALYFTAVYYEAVELCVHLCKLYGLGADSVICHSEGHALGIASNHADVMHWWPRHGRSMDNFRAEVGFALGVGAGPGPATLYRVRRSWGDARSQLGAFENLASAKALADKHPGYCVFDAKGERVHPAEPGCTIYTVVRGDYLWSIARKLLGKAERYKEIKVLNGLTSDAVYIGQQLKIPDK